MNLVISKISGKETYPVRHPVLRAGRPIEDCYFTGDELETTIHLGLFIKEELVAVGTFLSNLDATIEQLKYHKIEQCYQLRGMAVLKEMQGKQLGKNLLIAAEQLLYAKDVTALWFNARTVAVPFYEKMGYEKISEAFEIENVGTHYKMYKSL